MTNKKQEFLNKLLKRRIIIENNCWLFTGPSGKIKREIFLDGRNYLVSRVSAWIHFDLPLHDHKLVCHKCREKICWNPDHFYVGNTSTNNKDAVKDGTFRNKNINKEFCKYGHKLSGINLYIWKDYKTGQIHRWCKTCRNRLSNAT